MILVTGGTGFLGSTLIKILIEQGHEVVAIKRSSSVIPTKLQSLSSIKWIDSDITDYFSLSDAFQGITQVFHCAAKVSYQKKDAGLLQLVNVEGTKHIVNLCLEHGARLIHVSSIAALGKNKKGLPTTENDKWEFHRKISQYSLSKYKSELEVWRGIHEGLDAVIVNPSLIMGKDAGANGTGALFELVKKGMPLYPVGTIGVVDVHDVAQAMVKLMHEKDISAQRFILNSENISNKELLERIAHLLKKKSPSIEAKPLLLSIVWRLANILSFITGKDPVITKETSRASSAKLAYSNKKIIETLGFNFKPINTTLQEIATKYHQP